MNHIPKNVLLYTLVFAATTTIGSLSAQDNDCANTICSEADLLSAKASLVAQASEYQKEQKISQNPARLKTLDNLLSKNSDNLNEINKYIAIYTNVSQLSCPDLKNQKDKLSSKNLNNEQQTKLFAINKSLNKCNMGALIAGGAAAAAAAISSGDSSVDTIPPVITLNGSSSVTIELGSVYTEEGASAVDANDGVVDVTISGSVDTSTVGTYTITYTARDAALNTSRVTRTVIVEDTTAPVITVLGDNPATVEKGSSYTDAGATSDGGETVSSTSDVDTSKVGTYSVVYAASDRS